jgi:small subunit ribosomal protein S13
MPEIYYFCKKKQCYSKSYMAVRIVGVDLPQNKRGEIALTYIFGIGRSAAKTILEKAGVDVNIKVQDWTDAQAAKVREVIQANYKVEGDLRSELQLNIKRLMDIGCYRGIRHRIGLPVRGQSTKNNARTRKGRKKTVANKKKATK